MWGDVGTGVAHFLGPDGRSACGAIRHATDQQQPLTPGRRCRRCEQTPLVQKASRRRPPPNQPTLMEQ